MATRVRWLVLAILAGAATIGGAAWLGVWWLTPRPDSRLTPTARDTGGIDPKVVAAWEQAGADFRWLSHSEDSAGRTTTVSSDRRTDSPREIAGFVLSAA